MTKDTNWREQEADVDSRESQEKPTVNISSIIQNKKSQGLVSDYSGFQPNLHKELSSKYKFLEEHAENAEDSDSEMVDPTSDSEKFRP